MQCTAAAQRVTAPHTGGTVTAANTNTTRRFALRCGLSGVRPCFVLFSHENPYEAGKRVSQEV